MQNEDIKQTLIGKFGELVSNFEEPYQLLTFETTKENSLKVLTFLKEDQTMDFRFLNDLTAIHYPDDKGREICVMYMLQNIFHSKRIRLKVFVPVNQPDVYTATSLFETANWLERETYDFFGVNFVGHPNLIRIMNVDELDYFPLRKEYKLEEQTRKDKDDNMFGR